jgi:hypothetical protein
MSLTFLKKLNGNNNGHFKKYLNRLEGRKEPNISWYVSSGSDFRSPIFFNDSYMKDYINSNHRWQAPDIYFFTDYYPDFFYTLFPDKMTKSFTKPMSKFESLLTEYADLSGWYLFQDNRTSVRVKQFEFLPSIDAKVDMDLVDFQLEGNKPKQIAYMLLQFWSNLIGYFDVHLIYANVENEFMADKLVKSKAKISHITHVRYGSGFGLAKANGAYLKNILKNLETKFFISDPYLEPNEGDKAAVKLYPTLQSNGIQPKLLPLHVIPEKSWSYHGDVTVYKVESEKYNFSNN